MKTADMAYELALEAMLRSSAAAGGGRASSALQNRVSLNQLGITITAGTPGVIAGPRLFTPRASGFILIGAFSTGLATTGVTDVLISYQDDAGGSFASEIAAHASGIPSGAGLVSGAHVGASLSYLVGPFSAPFNFRLLGTVTGAAQTYTTLAGEGAIYVMELP